jgi:hypothetical protein
LDPFLLEGPFTVLEETLIILLGLSFSEALLLMLVSLPPLQKLPLLMVGPFLFKELLPFVVELHFLYVKCTLLKVQFTFVVGYPLMQIHLTVTEELLVTLVVSVFEGPLAILKNFLPLVLDLTPWRDISVFCMNFLLMMGLPSLERYITILGKFSFSCLVFFTGVNFYQSLRTLFYSWPVFSSH